ncbi:MAG: hypothetical protein GY786_01395 [Proteobacteria bacterium]|nr:hypothetical protein [Pseudomonadota bacterium]
MIKYLGKVPNESIVDIYGKVKFLKKPVESVSVKNLELQITNCYVISRANNVLPFQIDDGMNDENNPKEGQNIVALKTKLDNRVLDLRLPSNQAIFRIKAGVCRFYREFLTNEEFIEIQTPKLLGGTSEGGSEVFRFDYFGKEGCLA